MMIPVKVADLRWNVCAETKQYLCLVQAMASTHESIMSHVQPCPIFYSEEHLKRCNVATFMSSRILTLPTNLSIWIVGVGISSKVPWCNILCWLWWYGDEDCKVNSKYPSNNSVEHSKECCNLGCTTNITYKHNHLDGKTVACCWKAKHSNAFTTTIRPSGYHLHKLNIYPSSWMFFPTLLQSSCCMQTP